MTIHLVIRAPKSDSAAAAATSTGTTSAPGGSTSSESQGTTARPSPSGTSTGGFPFGLGMPPGLGNLNFANANFLDMQQQLQQQVNHRTILFFLVHRAFFFQIMSNPAQLRQLMESPMVQTITSNPDLLRSLLLSNPQMRDLMEVSSIDHC